MCRTQSKRFCQPCYFIKCADVCQYENGIPYDFPFDLSAVFIAVAGRDVDDANCDVFAKSQSILSVCAFRFCIAGKASRIFVLCCSAKGIVSYFFILCCWRFFAIAQNDQLGVVVV